MFHYSEICYYNEIGVSVTCHSFFRANSEMTLYMEVNGLSVKVSELLEDRFFEKFKVLAGHEGLDREIQSVALFDAPDGYKWYNGKEFVLTTGYLFKDNIELFKDVIHHLYDHQAAAIGVKVDRFLKQVPHEILELCNRLQFPLISVPYEPAWVEIINAINANDMNSYIMKINMSHQRNRSIHGALFPEMKIMEIIENLAIELDLSVSLMDFLEDENFHYPKREKTKELEKTLRNLLDPPFDYQKETIDDKINIYRIRTLEKLEYRSWVMIPIYVNDILVGKIVVWEKGKELGYFDLLALRITLAILVYIYGQIYYMNSKEANFHDDFIREILLEESDKEKLFKKAKNLNWDVHNKYVCISFKQINDRITLENHRDLIGTITGRLFPKKETLIGLLDGVIIIFQPAKEKVSQMNNEELAEKSNQLITMLEKEIPHATIIGGIGYSIDAFYQMKKSYKESIKTIEIGQLLYPERRLHFYKELGPFGLFSLESIQDEVHHVFESISPILQQEDKEELINTLKIFLESKCNFNLAAKRLYIHNNTVRYRISKIQQLCDLDLEDSTERLKLEITLKFVKHLDG